MSLYNEASLVMVPSAYKDQKVYSVKPIDGSGDLTFSRGSDIEATRVNANGYIEKAQVNLLLRSNTFSTTWVNVATTETGGQADKDGGTSAWKLEASSGGSSRVIGQTNALTGICTFSVYAKAGNISYLALENGTQFTYASLVDGTQGNNSGLIDYAATSVGNGWWRISIAFNKAASSDLRIYLASSNTSSVVSGGDYIYIQDAQLNYGLVAQTYQETTTAAVVSGITDNMPRLSYDPANPTCPSLLLEGSRTNVITSSEHLGSLSVSNVSVSYNNATSPEGVQNATLVTGDAGSGVKVVNFNGAANGSYTISVFAKYNTHQWIQLGQGGVATYANFDIQNGVTGGTNGTSSIEDYGGGWYRCSVVTTTGTPVSHYIGMVDSGTAVRLASSSSTNSYWAYGMQSELGSYPTSYIPTYGSSATRTADGPSGTSTTALGGGSVGSLYIEDTRNFIDTSLTGSAFQLLTSADNEEVRFHFDAPFSQVRFRDANNSYADIGGAISVTAGVKYKALFVSDGVTAKVFANGAQVGSDYSASVWDFDKFVITNKSHSVHQCIYFDSALSDADAITLTSL